MTDQEVAAVCHRPAGPYVHESSPRPRAGRLIDIVSKQLPTGPSAAYLGQPRPGRPASLYRPHQFRTRHCSSQPSTLLNQAIPGPGAAARRVPQITCGDSVTDIQGSPHRRITSIDNATSRQCTTTSPPKAPRHRDHLADSSCPCERATAE